MGYQTRGQQIGSLCVSSFSSFLSFAGSISIIYLILRNKRWKKVPSSRDGTGGMFYRLLLGLSFSDATVSISTLIAPYLQPPSPFLLAAAGTQQTCSLAGTMLFVTISGLFYNGFLASYYYCTIVKGIKEEELSKRYEKWMHISSIGVMVVYNTIALCLSGYNPMEINRFCGIEYYPTNCNQDPDVTCTRGLYTNELGITVLFLFAVPSIKGVVLTILVYWYVRKVLNKSRKYRYNTDEQENRRKHRLANQSLWYCLAYVNVVVWAVAFSALEATTSNTQSILGRPAVYTYLLLQSFFFPLQGFINFLNYCRPRYLDNRRRFPDRGRFYALLCVYNDEPPDYHASRVRSTIVLFSRRPTVGKKDTLRNHDHNKSAITHNTDAVVCLEVDDADGCDTCPAGCPEGVAVTNVANNHFPTEGASHRPHPPESRSQGSATTSPSDQQTMVTHNEMGTETV